MQGILKNTALIALAVWGLSMNTAKADDDPSWFKYIPGGVRPIVREGMNHHGSTTQEQATPGQDIDLDMDGSDDRDISNIDNQSVKVHFSGSSHLYLSGKTDTLKVRGTGSATIDVRDLTANEVYVDISGSATIYVHADQKLYVTATGSPEIDVYGAGELVRNDVSGSAKIIRR